MSRLLPWLFLGLVLSVRADPLELEIVSLQHRLARDLLPIILPMMAPGGTATGTSNQLVLRSTQENLAELRKIIQTLDTRLQQLRISVTLNASAVAADTPDETIRTHTHGDRVGSHFVISMEGQRAFLVTGQEIPQPQFPMRGNATPRVGDPQNVGRNQSVGGIEYHETTSGIYVTPHLQGEQVTIDIAPRYAQSQEGGNGIIDTNRAETTVTGRLGRWIPVGGSQVSYGEQGSEMLARTGQQGDNSVALWVKVDVQP